MRVLHVLEAVEGGTALHVRQLATGQLLRGHKVAVAIPTRRSWGRTDDTLGPDLAAAGADVNYVAMRRNPADPRNAVALAKLARLMLRWRPDVVHSHSVTGGILGRAAAAAARRRVVQTLNGARFLVDSSGVVARGERTAERLLRRWTDVAVAVSDSEAGVLRTIHHPERVVTIPNGVTVTDVPPAAYPETPTVVSVGRWTYQKDPITCVRVLSEVKAARPHVRTVMVGYGDMADEVRALAAERGGGIEFVDPDRGAEVLAAATVVLLTSRYEGAPYVILEAMERSRPVVATDTVGSQDAVVHGETGLLFPVGDYAAGAAAVIGLVDDAASVARMGGAGRARVATRFDVQTMVDDVERAYERILKS